MIDALERYNVECHSCGAKAMNTLLGYCQACDADLAVEPSDELQALIKEPEFDYEDKPTVEEDAKPTGRKVKMHSLPARYEKEFIDAIKVYAAEQGVSMRQFIRTTLEEAMASTEETDTNGGGDNITEES